MRVKDYLENLKNTLFVTGLALEVSCFFLSKSQQFNQHLSTVTPRCCNFLCRIFYAKRIAGQQNFVTINFNNNIQ